MKFTAVEQATTRDHFAQNPWAPGERTSPST